MGGVQLLISIKHAKSLGFKAQMMLNNTRIKQTKQHSNYMAITLIRRQPDGFEKTVDAGPSLFSTDLNFESRKMASAFFAPSICVSTRRCIVTS